jgi:hypothetical protein
MSSECGLGCLLWTGQHIAAPSLVFALRSSLLTPPPHPPHPTRFPGHPPQEYLPSGNRANRPAPLCPGHAAGSTAYWARGWAGRPGLGLGPPCHRPLLPLPGWCCRARCGGWGRGQWGCRGRWSRRRWHAPRERQRGGAGERGEGGRRCGGGGCSGCSRYAPGSSVTTVSGTR